MRTVKDFYFNNLFILFIIIYLMQPFKNKFWNNFEKVLNKVAGARSAYRRSYVKSKDDGLGRERIATDKYGNNYYQYYSYHGLPTRRVVLYKWFDANKFH